MKVGNLEIELEPQDRVLTLSVPPAGVIRELSEALNRGGLVVLGDRGAVYETRRLVRDLHNVMLHPGPPEEIPFDDAWFTKIFDSRCQWEDAPAVGREVARTLGDGGRVYLSGGNPEHFTAAGLNPLSLPGPGLAFEKPERSRPDAPPLELPIVR